MPSLKTYLVAAALACSAAANTIRVTATTINTFNPDTIRAQPGDTIEFHFQGRNHSVVSGIYENPCSPLQLGNGFFPGFMPTPGGEAVCSPFHSPLPSRVSCLYVFVCVKPKLRAPAKCRK